MSRIILSFHPVFQAFLTTLALYVFSLGLNRFFSVHLGRPAVFNWRRHVSWGKVVLMGWLTGIVLGALMVFVHWGKPFITGLHGRIGLSMAPLVLFGLSSGLYLDFSKKKRTALPLIHGIVNLLALILAVLQVFTGILTFKSYVLGN